MKEAIVLVLWLSGVGFQLGQADSWEDCDVAMSALDKLNLETSCHLMDVPVRPKKRPW